MAFILLIFLLAVPLAAQQTESDSQQDQNQQGQQQQDQQPEGEQQEESEPAPPPGPRIREVNGVVIIGSSSAPVVPEEPEETEGGEQPAEEAPQAAEPAEAASAEESPAGTAAPEQPVAEGAPPEQPAPEEASPSPTRRSQRIRIYNASGRPVETNVAEVERESEDEAVRTQTLTTISDREVPYLSEREQVLSETPTEKTVEQRKQRYDPNGNPTQQEVVREQVRTLPDGTVVTTATTYVEDINGRLQPVERSVTREKKQGGRVERTTVTERPSINGGFQPHTREESVEVRQGEELATIETVRKVNDGSGRLITAAREETVMSKSGNASTTEKKVWERDKLNREMSLARRTEGTLVTHPDGSSTETVRTYGHDLGDGSGRFLSATSPQLLRTLTRETEPGPSGETIETTRVRERDPADPSMMEPVKLEQKVQRPGEDATTIETHVYEQTVNGRMQPTQVIVEQVEK